jgi:hypothetical protein
VNPSKRFHSLRNRNKNAKQKVTIIFASNNKTNCYTTTYLIVLQVNGFVGFLDLGEDLNGFGFVWYGFVWFVVGLLVLLLLNVMVVSKMADVIK